MQNIVITGGCGFIGVNLIRFLMKTDESVCIRVVDNLSVGQLEDLDRVCTFQMIKAEELTSWDNGATLVVGDIQDAKLADSVCQGADGVVHLAANTGVIPSIEDPRMDCVVNVLGTFNYLDACRKSNVKRFVFASSGAPLGEQNPPIHEEMVPRPISPYGASKLCGEAYCSAYYGSFGLETVALRFGNVYGPRSSHKGSVVAKFIKQILERETLTIYGDGSQTRDFIYIDDLIRAVWAGLTVPGVGGHVFQIATHREHTVKDLFEVLSRLAEELLGYTPEVIYASGRKGEVLRSFSDISKAKRMLAWEPLMDFSRGLERTFDWFIEQYRLIENG